jgi:hypothetical protein
MLSSLITAICEWLSNYLIGLWKAEKAEADRISAESHKRQVEAFGESLAEEKAINSTPIPVIETVDDWNNLA